MSELYDDRNIMVDILVFNKTYRLMRDAFWKQNDQVQCFHCAVFFLFYSGSALLMWYPVALGPVTQTIHIFPLRPTA